MVGTVRPFSARKMRTRRGLGAVYAVVKFHEGLLAVERAAVDNRVNCGGLASREPCSQRTTLHVSNRSARGQHHSSSTTNTGNVSGHAGSARVCQFRTLQPIML